MRYLITGGAGFIGSHLADALTTRGDEVVVLDDLSTGRVENVQHLIESGHMEFIEGSVLDRDLLRETMANVDYVMHLASAVGVQLIVERPLDSLQRNIRGNDLVISTAAELRRPLLFTSTSEVYGKNSEGALHEESDRVLGSPFKSRWAYSTAKAFGEALAHSYHREQHARMSVVRLFNTVGPRQTGAYGMVLPRFVQQAMRNEDLTVFGNGTQSRCFAHVLDTVHAIVLVADTELSSGKVFNVGNPVEVAIVELAGRVIERLGSKSRITLVPYNEAYEKGFEELGRRMPDTRALEQLTGWQPTRTVDEAIDDVFAYEQGRAAAEGRKLRVAG